MSFGVSIGDFIAVLQLANDVRKQFVDAPSQLKAISEEVKILSNVLQDIDDILPARDLTSQQQTELDEIVQHCQSILRELNKILRRFKELDPVAKGLDGKLRRVWKRFDWDQKHIDELRNRISSNILLLNTFLGGVSSQAVFTIRDGMEKLQQCQETRDRKQEHDTILEWLTPFNYATQQQDLVSRRQAGTGQWFLNSGQFQTWLNTDRQTFFCPGIPGAGKTILSSIVVEELTSRFSDDPTIGIAYIYCNFRRQHEQTINDLLMSILKQLAETHSTSPGPVTELYDRHKTRRTRPSLEETSKCLQAVATRYSRVFIIADALDECQIDNSCRQRFLSSLFDLRTKCRVNLFATSRPISSIEKEFEGNSRLEIRASEGDVRRYLEGHMDRLPGFVVHSPKLQEEVKTSIVQAVDGMFLLAQLHLESLIEKRSPKAVRVALKNLATGSRAYDYAYEDAMERINGQLEDQRELAKDALLWITCAKRQLTTEELQHALGVEVGEPELDADNFPQIEDIVSVCAGLVTIDEESEIIRLVHYTTQEYFDRTREKWFPNAATYIGKNCVTYLLFDAFASGICQNEKEFEQRLQFNKLYNYAANNWGHHAREASTLCQGVIEFLHQQPYVEASCQALWTIHYWTSHWTRGFEYQMTGLHLAAYFGVEDGVRSLLRKNSPDLKNSLGQTPLSLAAKRGHKAITTLLLEEGAQLETRDNNGRTPLSWAAKSDQNIVTLLLQNGANVSAKDNFHETPLLIAVKAGNEATVKLLLATNRLDVNLMDYYNSTPLSIAARLGHKDLVELLLTKSHALNVQDNFHRTPLWWARRTAHHDIVDLLLETHKERAITVQEDDLPPVLIPVPDHKCIKIGDVCILGISDEDK